MKKAVILFLVGILVVFCFGCNSETDVIEDVTTDIQTTVEDVPQIENEIEEEIKRVFLFPEGTVICGVDVSGMENGEAYDAVTAFIDTYTFTLTVNGRDIVFTAEDIELCCVRKTITDYYKALSDGKTVEVPTPLTYNEDVIINAVSANFNKAVSNAIIRYNSSAHRFEVVADSSGRSIDIDSVMNVANPAIMNLNPSAAVDASVYEIEPTIKAGSNKANSALSSANSYLDISLQYTFTPDGGSTSTETITKDRIASFISVDSNLSVKIDTSAVNKYVLNLSDKYSVAGEPGKFVTTGGNTINISVTYAGQPVDTDALYKDLYNCLSNKISGVREAPYKAKTKVDDMSFGGNYVEVNLSAQYLWVYKNGECVVSTPLVSGCAFYGWNTPTGVYSVNDKTPGCYLKGATYTTWVNYWIGFIGNSYGIHDATWRDSFGGDIYLYDGSHGCVNVPLGAAASIYNNVSLGTKVIIYGGASNAEPVQQIIKGTTEYNVASDASSFKLDTELEYKFTDLIYISDNPEVATVSADGTVNIVSVGTANIIVTAPEIDYYTSAEMVIKINVTSACDEGRHTYGEWTVINETTCVVGSEMRKCDYCGITENKSVAPVKEHTPGEEVVVSDATCTSDGHSVIKCTACGTEIKSNQIPASGHNFVSNAEYCANNCGALNPDYIPPSSGDEGEMPGGDNTGGDSGFVEDNSETNTPDDPGEIPGEGENPPEND